MRVNRENGEFEKRGKKKMASRADAVMLRASYKITKKSTLISYENPAWNVYMQVRPVYSSSFNETNVFVKLFET